MNKSKCEWMANYHDAKNPYVLREADYPTLDEQKNFLRAYVEHHRSNSGSRTNSTPRPQLMISSSYSFSLDARTPGNQYKEEEAARQKATEKEIEQLLYETNIWRPASSAMWCAWGIVQAKDKDKEKSPNTESGEEEEPAAEEEDDEFNYFGYAQQRALLFLGDLLTLGVMSEEELGPAVVQKVKRAEMWGHPERELELASVP